jgi:A/G-specific adenine glycosylase
MMELGALVCRPKNPQCPACPVNRFCKALADDTVPDYPRRAQKKTTPTRHRVAGAVLFQGKLLIVRRKTNGFLGGMWEFPDTSVKKSADPEKTCQHEIKRLTGLTVTPISLAAQVRHTYSHFKLVLDVYLFTTPEADVTLVGYADSAWVAWDDLAQYPFHKAVHKCFPGLLQQILPKTILHKPSIQRF